MNWNVGMFDNLLGNACPSVTDVTLWDQTHWPYKDKRTNLNQFLKRKEPWQTYFLVHNKQSTTTNTLNNKINKPKANKKNKQTNEQKSTLFAFINDSHRSRWIHKISWMSHFNLLISLHKSVKICKRAVLFMTKNELLCYTSPTFCAYSFLISLNHQEPSSWSEEVISHKH